MVFKFSSHIKILSGLLALLLIYQCSSDQDTTAYITSVRNGEFKARIVADSTSIFRSERDNVSLAIPITYKAVLLDDDIDSLEWICCWEKQCCNVMFFTTEGHFVAWVV